MKDLNKKLIILVWGKNWWIALNSVSYEVDRVEAEVGRAEPKGNRRLISNTTSSQQTIQSVAGSRREHAAVWIGRGCFFRSNRFFGARVPNDVDEWTTIATVGRLSASVEFDCGKSGCKWRWQFTLVSLLLWPCWRRCHSGVLARPYKNTVGPIILRKYKLDYIFLRKWSMLSTPLSDHLKRFTAVSKDIGA